MACCNQPRPDCCRIPCSPPFPSCTEGICVERTQSCRPEQYYEPPCFPFENLTTYRENYPLKCGEKARSYKPMNTFEGSCAKMDGVSTYREFYTPKPLCPVQKPPWAQQGQYQPSCAKMDGCSTYRYDYKGCCGERTRSMKPEATFCPSDAKMDGCTTYRFNYVPYCSREYAYAKQPPYKRDMTPAFSCSKMDGVSTYRQDFWPKCCAKRRSMKPTNKTRFSDAKFADRTTYRNDFHPFYFQGCPRPCAVPPAQFCCGPDPVVPTCTYDDPCAVPDCCIPQPECAAGGCDG